LMPALRERSEARIVRSESNSAKAPATPSGAASGYLKEGEGEACLPPWPSPIGPGMLPYSFPKFQAGIIALPDSSLSFSRNPNDAPHEGQHEPALLVLVSAQAATIIDGNTIDIRRRADPDRPNRHVYQIAAAG
jgi:hypothetical protein